jgi:hypothetical protein
MRAFADMIQARELLVSNSISFMDSVLFAMQSTGDCVEQNAYYCGYKCITMVNSVHMAPIERYFLQQTTFLEVGRTVA